MIKLSCSQALYYLKTITGNYFPTELIGLIMMIFYRITKIKISCGGHHTIILINESLYGFGDNTHGQLGLGDCQSRTEPQLINLSGIKKITCSSHQTLASTNRGNFYVFGRLYKCEELSAVYVPEKIEKPFKLRIRDVRKMNHCRDHLIMVTKDNEIYTLYNHFKKHIFLDIKKIRYGSHNMILTKSGKLYGYGENQYGQLGLGHSFYVLEKTNFEEVGSIFNCVDVSCGDNHTIALTSDNKLYVWGCNKYGQLGLGDTEGRNTPHELVLNDVNKLNIVSVSCGIDHTFILLNTNQVYVCGNNLGGKLGREPYDYVCTPLKLSFNGNISHISSGWDHIIFRTIDNILYGCGSNKFGQLGFRNDGDDTYLVPTKLCL